MPFAVSVPQMFSQIRSAEPVRALDVNPVALGTAWGASRTNPMVELAKAVFEARKAQSEAGFNRQILQQATGQTVPPPNFFDQMAGANGPNIEQIKTLSSILENKSQAALRDSQMGLNHAKAENPSQGRMTLEEFGLRQDDVLQRMKDYADYQRKYKSSDEAPMSADAAGRYEFAEETLRNIPKIRKLMFKDGVFNQGLVNKALAGKYTKDPDVQNLKRWVVGNLTSRGLIQSGVVIKDNEWARLAQQYGIDLFSAPEAALYSLNEQEQFMMGFKKRVRPGGSTGSTADGGETTFNSPMEADASGLPPGTVVTVQGRPYQI